MLKNHFYYRLPSKHTVIYRTESKSRKAAQEIIENPPAHFILAFEKIEKKYREKYGNSKEARGKIAIAKRKIVRKQAKELLKEHVKIIKKQQ